MFFLCLIALFNTVQPATLEQLNIDKDQAPLLLKDARILTADQAGVFTPTYKPYSIFGEQLSHISEEDSQLDRMITNGDSLRQVTSYDSYAPSFYSRNTTANSELHHYYSRYTEEQQTIDESQNNTMVHVYALALLPSPTTTDPLVALLSKEEDEEIDEDLFPKNYYYYNQQNNTQILNSNSWKISTLNITFLLMGTTKALLNTFLFVYLHSTFAISILNISVLIAVHTTSEMLTHYAIEKWYTHKINLVFASTLSHISLVLCFIIYPALKPDGVSACVILVALQAVQASAFQLIWSSGIDQVQTVINNQYERMKERARASLLFSSLGPAIGSILAGLLLNNNPNDYMVLFKISVAVSSLSFIVSWGWTSTE
ncbi:hypothetical protein BY458DRAFT_444222 [Sporodiniella umbellata]|nr:hypothetical protein BY458DRAFT_444222 [Sporodiniella umbellata]